LQGGSYASYALRFAAGFDQMMMVLSGMSTIEQVEDNVSFMKDVVPLDEKELDLSPRIDISRQIDCRKLTDTDPKKV